MIKITEDPHSEMLRIEFKDNCIFEGNYHDFDISGEGFKKLFKRMKLKVETVYKDYDEWYD